MRPPFLPHPGLVVALILSPAAGRAFESVQITGVPDYAWHAGCFGTATGNLMGFWDRHGFPDFYTGPTAGGVAPLDSFGANRGIVSLWASEAGVDGRPLLQPGHMDNYYVHYESVSEDPYRILGRPEHPPDCIGDFIGLSQRKWASLADECEGNIDAYAFNFFDRQGHRRDNYTPTDAHGLPIPDIQSGLRAWTRSRGYEADTFSQLSDFNPDGLLSGQGFTFQDLRAEIDRGYPVLLFMQPFGRFSRTVAGRPNQNPLIHALLAYGYLIDHDGTPYVRYRTSWASGDLQFSAWTSASWTPNGELNLPLRGVIGYRPLPRIVAWSRTAGALHFAWHGPLATLRDDVSESDFPAHRYVVERSPSLDHPVWEPITGPVAMLEIELPDCCPAPSFFRVRLLDPTE
ncbi:MAG: hypothetical protein KF833_23775 [Verrucomicrobiae bacterium]|nr:hypothetical protein [Verrucomicrobiae bacterium]